jgi:predicted DNA-binding transcriptional regulator YafY
MDKFDRFQSLHRIFMAYRKPVSLAMLADRMDCSEKTVKRAIEDMRDFFGAPIEYFPDAKGWHYNPKQDEKFVLPGLWLTGEELQSLTLLLHVLEGFGNGLLNEELAVVEKEIEKLLAKRGISTSAFAEHIKVLPMANRNIPGKIFTEAGEAILKRQKITIQYKDYNNRKSSRTISPQTLVHYRDNWYLDAWCHMRNDLRTFSLARIETLQLCDEQTLVVPKDKLTEYFSASYGIFSGKGKHTARLRFLPEIAREISRQQWHPQQQGEWEGEDYLLSLPYSDDRELIGDIQRYLPHVIVEAPAELKKRVQNRIHAALELFTNERIRRP